MDGPSRQPEIAGNLVDPGGGFPLGAPEYFFHLLFQAAHRRGLSFDTSLEAVGLNLVQWRVLTVVRRIENCTMTTLARYTGIERTTLTRTVDQLVERDFVMRCVPETDRRQVNLAMTESGETRFAQAWALMQDRNDRMLAQITPKRLREATRFLQQILQGIVDDDALAQDLLNFSRPAGSPRP